MLWKGYQSPRVKRKPALRRKKECVFSGKHMDNVPKETHVVSVMTSKTLETEAKARDEEDDRLLLHPNRMQNRLTARDKPHKDQAVNKKTHWMKVKFHADSDSVKIRHISSGTFLCVWNKSGTWCVHGDKCISDILRQGESPTRSRKGWCKGLVALLKESVQLGCVSQDYYPRKSILREPGHLGSKHTVKFSQAPGTESKFGWVLSKSVRLMSVVFARQNSGKDHIKRPSSKNDPPAKQRGIWRKTFTSSSIWDKTTGIFLISPCVFGVTDAKRFRN